MRKRTFTIPADRKPRNPDRPRIVGTLKLRFA